MSSLPTNKHRRSTDAGTAEDALLTPHAAAASKPSASKKAKKAKKNASVPCKASPSSSETPALSPADALTAAIAGAKKTRTKRPNAAEKKAAFLAKFSGKSPEEVLGASQYLSRMMIALSDLQPHFRHTVFDLAVRRLRSLPSSEGCNRQGQGVTCFCLQAVSMFTLTYSSYHN